MNMIPFIFGFWFIILIIALVLDKNPLKATVAKYGTPRYHFKANRALYSLPTKGIGVTFYCDIYNDFIVITNSCKKEYIIKKDFLDYEIYGSLFCYILELNYNNEKFQLCLMPKDKKNIEEFFNS